MNNVICIAGSSGVGKTTIAKLIRTILPIGEVLMLSGDDLHKWPRKSPHWTQFTHLNPHANYIEKGADHIEALKNGQSIERRVYNHDTGFFKNAIKVDPRQNIIYEGLHALYDSKIRDLSDIKIYVDTEEELKVDWKIDRDTKKRGYTRQQAISAIEKRKEDEEKYIKPQKQYADIVVRYSRKNAKICLDCEVITPAGTKLASEIKELFAKQQDFLSACKELTENEELVQHKGGNVSYGYADKLIISSSGTSLSDVSVESGFCICDPQQLDRKFDNELDYTEAINKSKIVDTSERPSMEVGLHAALQDLGQAVLHTHPLCLNSILCSKQAGSIIGNLYSKFNYVFIPYITPGHELSNMVSNKNLYEAPPANSSATVIFMQNHGLVVVCDSLKECVAVTKEINEISRHFLNQRLRMQAPEQSRRIWYSQPGEHLFPDSVVLAKETMFAHAYVFNNILQAGLIPRCLSDSDINKLLKLESEKYRREIE